jgi:hypothetical protein
LRLNCAGPPAAHLNSDPKVLLSNFMNSSSTTTSVHQTSINYLSQAKHAVERLHLCAANHVETVRVCEYSVGRKIWDADVEIFDLQGYAVAERSYVWGYQNEKRNGDLDFISVPATPSITNASAAVAAVLAWEEKLRR